MEEIKDLIHQLSANLDNKSLKTTLSRITENIKNTASYHETKKEAIEDSIHQLQRKNKQIESDVERLQLLQSKNASVFNKKSTERIRLSRKIIELEQENEVLEASSNDLEGIINKLEDEIKILSHPTTDELYYEIVKGFGVEFLEINGMTCARIQNKSKNDIFTVECVDAPADVCDKIWQYIE